MRKVYRTGARHVEALKGVDLAVGRGEFVAVMGVSGSGKTTLLNCLSGLDEVDGGSVLVEERDLHGMRDAERTAHRARRMGFVFQAFNLIPVLSATENVELPLLLNGVRSRDARRRARRVLARVSLDQRLDHRPNELSGGEQQRVAVARAIAIEPALIWADEPTGNLDTATAGRVLALLSELHTEGLTLILVTHDPRSARPRRAAPGHDAGRPHRGRHLDTGLTRGRPLVGSGPVPAGRARRQAAPPDPGTDGRPRRRPAARRDRPRGTRLASGDRDHHQLAHRGRHAGRLDPGERPQPIGPTDLVVRSADPDAAEAALAGLEDERGNAVDGVLAIRTVPAAVATPGGGGRRAQPVAQLLEADFPDAARFGGDPAATGISGATPGDGETVVTDDLAEDLGVDAGDRVEVFA